MLKENKREGKRSLCWEIIGAFAGPVYSILTITLKYQMGHGASQKEFGLFFKMSWKNANKTFDQPDRPSLYLKAVS